MNKLITTPIYYANGKPHIGHALTTVLADVFSRSLKMQGVNVFFSTGLDEHGQKNQKIIDDGKLDPKKYFNDIAESFKELFKNLNIEYDKFIRTTSEEHKRVVQYILQKLYDEGKFFKQKVNYKYCVGCEMFKTDEELDENGCCKDHKRPAISIEEENYYFDLAKNKDFLVSLLKREGFLTKNYRPEMLNMAEKLPPLCISRPKTKVWLGIEFPFDRDYVTYVWFDALINYITVLNYPNWNQREQEMWANSLHLIGKDIVKPHSIYWTIMLHEAGIAPPSQEFVHGFITTGGVKMGKSLGNGLNPYKAIEIFGSDSVRFVTTKLVSATDFELDYGVMLNHYNTDLANIIGNSFFRTYSFARKTFKDATTPKANFSKEQEKFLSDMKENLETILPRVETIEDGNEYIRKLLDCFRMINVYLDKTAPWSLTDAGEKEQALLCVLECLRMCFVVASPVLVESSKKVLQLLKVDFDAKNELNLQAIEIKEGVVLEETAPLFNRLKIEEVEEKLK